MGYCVIEEIQKSKNSFHFESKSIMFFFLHLLKMFVNSLSFCRLSLLLLFKQTFFVKLNKERKRCLLEFKNSSNKKRKTSFNVYFVHKRKEISREFQGRFPCSRKFLPENDQSFFPFNFATVIFQKKWEAKIFCFEFSNLSHSH